MKAWRSPFAFSHGALGAALLVFFVACGDDSDAVSGGASGSSTQAGSADRDEDRDDDAGHGGATATADRGAPTGAGASSHGGAGEAHGGNEGTEAGRSGAAASDGGGTAGASGGGSSGSGGVAGSGNAGHVSSIPGVPCDVAATINQRCVACHGDPPVLDAPYPLTTYGALTEHAEDVYSTLENDLMPPPPMVAVPEAEKNALLKWLDDGTPFTTGACE